MGKSRHNSSERRMTVSPSSNRSVRDLSMLGPPFGRPLVLSSTAPRQLSEFAANDQSKRARLGRMEMHVIDGARLACQARRVEVVDLVRLLVQDVGGIDPHGQAVREYVA